MSTPIRPLSDTAFPAPAADTPTGGPALVEPRLLLPEETESTDRSSLHSAAQSVGNAVGRAMSNIRQLPHRLTVIRGRGSQQASQTADELRDKAADVQQLAKNRFEQLRRQANAYVEANPLQAIGGIFGAFFAIGIGLRIWRSRD